MSKGQSLQDPFLNALRRERVPVAIYLVNGIKLQGTVESFDQFVVLLRNQVSKMVYKHAIPPWCRVATCASALVTMATKATITRPILRQPSKRALDCAWGDPHEGRLSPQ